MSPNEKSQEGLIPENTLAVGMKEETKGLRGGLYRNMSPEKSAALANIVDAGFRDMVEAERKPRCRKGDILTIRERTVEYVHKRIDERRLPTIEGLAVALGINRSTLFRWMKDSADKDVYEYLSMVYECFADMHSSAALANITNPVSWIFYSKNMLGFHDKTDLTVTSGTHEEYSEAPTPEQLEAKYADVIVDDE